MLRYVFYQEIVRASDMKLCTRAKVELVCLVNGILADSEDYDRAFAEWL